MRKFTKTLAVMSILAPSGAYPLGVGDIQMHSALNQKLNADIALVLSDTENVGDIRVSLAPPEKFDEAGIPWNYFLSKIDFKTVKKANGTVVINLSSRDVLNEPILDFLLEVSWPKGNIYREFTVLVDPPATYQHTVVPVTIAAVTPGPVSGNRTTTKSQATGSSARFGATNSIESSYRNGEYGPTNRFDTLWSIARKVKPSSDITDRQMMIALYEANPKAFYKPNVNALAAGHTLRVPGRDVILKMSRQQASVAFAQQNEAWQAGTIAASKNDKSSGNGADSEKTNQLKLVAPEKTAITDNVVSTAGQDETDSSGNLPGTGDVEALNEVNQELETKMMSLEQKLANMQKMLELKDAQLAALQTQSDVFGQDIGEPVEEAIKTQQILGDIEKQTQNVTESQAPASTVVAEKSKPEIQQQAEQVPDEQKIPQSDTDAGVGTYYLTAGGIGIGIFAVLGFFWWKKRNEEVKIDTDSMFASSSEITLPDMEEGLSIPGIEASSTYDVGTVGESSFLSEFTPSDFESFEMDQSEVDPISEADVYLAYGRYKQAEELMRQAIEDQPGRDECKLKLLEIYYANEDKDAFEKYATELAEAGKRDDQSFWDKVTEMGLEINSDSELFKEAETTLDMDDSLATEPMDIVFENADESSAPSDADLSSGSPIVNGLDEEKTESLDSESQDNEIEFSFDLESDSNPENEELASFQLDDGKSELNSEVDEIDNIGFDLSDDEPINEQSNSEPEELESFDFSSTSSLSDNSLEEKAENDMDMVLDIDTEKEFEELSEMDEYETKIDLAKAYIDMGDDEAAKEIVQEVLDKGDDTQKQAAGTVLDKLK